MLSDLSVARIGGAIISSGDKRDQTLGTALVGAVTWWMLRDVKEA